MTPLFARSIPLAYHATPISTERLDSYIPQIEAARLTVVSAPAGAGKTTALMRWADRLGTMGRKIAWLTLGEDSSDLVGLAAAIAASMARASSSWNQDMPPAGRVTDPASNAASLSNAWFASEEPITLFLDGMDDASPAAIALVLHLIDDLPPNGQLLIASRVTLDLDLSRVRLFGGLVEIESPQLRLTVSEVRKLMGDRISDEAVNTLMQATDGWAASVALASRTLDRGVDSDAMLRTISGRAACMTAFFDETILSRIDAPVADFLISTSFLDELEPALCEAAMGRSGSLAMLNTAKRLNLFIEPLNEEHTRFRLMRPFREFLARRREELDPLAEQTMCRAIAHHLFAKGESTIGLEYAARTQDQCFLAGLLEQHCEELTYRGDILTVMRLAAQLPDAGLNRLPRLLLILAWGYIRNLEVGAARAMIERARARTDAMALEDAGSAEVEWLRLILLHRQTMVSAAEDDFETVEANSQILMPRLQQHSYLMCSIQAQLMVARREQYRLSDLPSLEARARAALTTQSCDFAAITLELSIGPGLMATGKLGEAIAALERAYDQGVRLAGEGSSMAALAALPLAEALYERNDLKRASELIEKHIDKARSLSFADQLISGFLTRARICQARGDINGALRAVEDGIKLGLERNLERLRVTMVSEKIRLMLRNGQSSRAVEIASASGIHGPGANFAPSAKPTTLDELRAMAWCRLGLSQDRVQEVILVVKQWRRFCVTRGATRSVIRWSLLLAICLTMEGTLQAALRTLREAAAAGSDGRWIRCFLDEGRVIKTLIAECLGRSNLAPGAVDQFYVEIMSTHGEHGTPGGAATPVDAASADLALYGRLLPRELEILSLVGTGMRNREIGTRLGLTEGTIKWYMTQIYDKVGVRRRPQAVDRARMFGLLA
ncbi:MAG: LuxR C-terminal-related transcriptional regulator [Janthinobacterium lividum]